jgi:hypothetical protein
MNLESLKMTKLEYLKLCILNKSYQHVSWFIHAFSVIRVNSDEVKKNPKYLYAYPEPWGYIFIDKDTQSVKIDNTKTGEPLFSFQDTIQVDSSWAKNIDSPTETTVGRLLWNVICVSDSFDGKLKFINEPPSIKKIEKVIAFKLKDTPVNETERSREYFYVDEKLKFDNALTYTEQLATLCNRAATLKNITRPDNIKEFRDKLIKQYGEENLNDPVTFTKFKAELSQYDKEYLKDDPTLGKLISGKLISGRDKLYLTTGAELGFKETVKQKPILTSLVDGWSKDPKTHTMTMNGIRSGSYSRGMETVNGGVTAKVILRAANNYTVIDTDCGSKLGLSRIYTKDNVSKIINRYMITQSGQSVLIDSKERAESYLGKVITMRTPAFCNMQGESICKVCAGLNLAQYATGLAIPLTEISARVLAASMKKMHGVKMATAKIGLENFS